jgi:hypothetical protein
LEKYQNEMDFFGAKEKVLSTRALAPADFHKVGDAFPLGISFNIPGNMKKCIFEPHHRIIIADAAGNVTLVRVCFICDAVALGDDAHLDLFEYPPDAWKKTLRQFFTDEGMPESIDLYGSPVTR